MLISPATLDDIPALADLINRAYRGEAAHAGWTTEGHLLDGLRADAALLREMVAVPHTQFLKKEVDGALVGCVYLEPRGDAVYLSLLAVDPARQSQGLGQRLLLAAEAFTQRLKRHQIKISVLEARPELLAWYERQGYQRLGQPVPFPSSTRFGRPRQPLQLVMMAKKVQE